MNIIKGFMNLLLKSGPCDLNRYDEPKIKRESQKARMVNVFTLVNKVVENQSLIKCKSEQVMKTKYVDS